MSQHTATPFVAAGIMVRYDRMADGALVAVHTHRGRSVAAIVHPHVESLREVPQRRWVLAGDLEDRAHRPKGQHPNAAFSCAEAAEALGVELGISVAGWSVVTIDEAGGLIGLADVAPEEEATTVCYCGTVIADLVEETDGTCGAIRCRRVAAQDLAGLIP